MKNRLALLLVASAFVARSAGADDLPRRKDAPRESYPGIDVEYGTVSSPGGPRLRTIVTKPAHAGGRLPALFLAGWLSCDSIEAAPGAEDSTAKMLRGLATRSGMVFCRVDKPGVGDSEGVCGDTDFRTELEGYRAAYRQLSARPDVDPARVFVFGWSNGGGFAPLVPDDKNPAAGYVVSGGWVKTWFEHMMEFERRRFGLAGKRPGEINDLMRVESEFYDLYLNREMTPAAALRSRPDLAAAWSDEPERQYGRPARFYQQLQRLNLADAWSRVDVPVLSLFGQSDFIMCRDDHERIAAMVDARHPGFGRFVEVPRSDHVFALHDSAVDGMTRMGEGPFAEQALTTILNWLKERAGAPLAK